MIKHPSLNAAPLRRFRVFQLFGFCLAFKYRSGAKDGGKRTACRVTLPSTLMLGYSDTS
jgi:hypothetical protein